MQTTKDTDLVVRNNKLINANIKLTAKEYDLVRTFMKYIKRSDTDFWTFTVLANEVGIENKRGKGTVRSIGRKPVEIELGKDGLMSIPFFTYLKYQNGTFEGRFNEDLKEVLLEISSNFTKTYEKYILPMDSIYAKRIYEMLSENRNIGYRKFRIEDLYETLQISKSMRNYANFKKYVLIVAIREINEHSDIYIPIDIENLKDDSWISLQCGKKRGVTHLNFTFRLKNDKGLLTACDEEETVKPTNDMTQPPVKTTADYIRDYKKIFIKESNRSWLDYEAFPIPTDIMDNIHMEFGIKEIFIYPYMYEFMDYIIRENKPYPDLAQSFYRHLKGKFQRGIEYRN